MNKSVLIPALALMICGMMLQGLAHAEDTLELEGATIIGNRELPKVLYIMPWKKAEPGDIVDRPISSIFDEVIAPVDREVFRRNLEYYNKLNESK